MTTSSSMRSGSGSNATPPAPRDRDGGLRAVGDGGAARQPGQLRTASSGGSDRQGGVWGGHVEYEVRVDPGDHFDDDQIDGVALQALISDAEAPGDRVDVGVVDGWLTLQVEVKDQYESNAAFEAPSAVLGVAGSQTRSRSSPPASTADNSTTAQGTGRKLALAR